jgi:hypothetical protein
LKDQKKLSQPLAIGQNQTNGIPHTSDLFHMKIATALIQLGMLGRF